MLKLARFQPLELLDRRWPTRKQVAAVTRVRRYRHLTCPDLAIYPRRVRTYRGGDLADRIAFRQPARSSAAAGHEHAVVASHFYDNGDCERFASARVTTLA